MCGKGKIASVLIVVTATLILFSTTSQSQGLVKHAREGGGMGYSMFGWGTLDIEALNSRLESKGYSSMSDNFFSVGGGGHGIINNKVIIGGEGHTLLGEEITSGNYKNSINVGYGFFNVGYIVYSKKQLRLYPLLGIGGGGINLKIKEKPVSLSFDDVLNDPERSVELSTGGFLLSFAVGMDYLLLLGGDEEGEGGLVFGLRAGYTLSPFKRGWEMDEIEISGAPDIGITGPFIRLMFGGGGFEKQD